jgi:predicted nucleic acid-binding Zn ribbon protein
MCERCGDSDGRPIVTTATDDPLEVSECERCGALLDIGDHDW